jgi:hypothetical protein
MSKRRTAEEAFEMPASVQDFIDRGVQDSSRSMLAAMTVAVPATELVQSKPREKVIELAEERQPQSTTTRRANMGRGALRVPQSSPDDLTRTYAKATVQKTIRFHPRLIAELDAYTRQHELDAEKPKAFQQIQNEALDLWLDQHVRRMK